MTNEQLRAAWHRKLPKVDPTDRELSAFALGFEAGEEKAHRMIERSLDVADKLIDCLAESRRKKAPDEPGVVVMTWPEEMPAALVDWLAANPPKVTLSRDGGAT